MEQVLDRLVARYGKRRVTYAALWTTCWLTWQFEAIVKWLVSGRSPLIWQNAAGVLEWVVWTSVVAALLIAAFCQMFRELEGSSLGADLRALGRYFLTGLAFVTMIFALGGFRVWVRADALFVSPDLWPTIAAHPGQALALGLGLLGLIYLLPAMVFFFRLCGILLKHGISRG